MYAIESVIRTTVISVLFLECLFYLQSMHLQILTDWLSSNWSRILCYWRLPYVSEFYTFVANNKSMAAIRISGSWNELRSWKIIKSIVTLLLLSLKCWQQFKYYIFRSATSINYFHIVTEYMTFQVLSSSSCSDFTSNLNILKLLLQSRWWASGCCAM
jgi:hypothetical protein